MMNKVILNQNLNAGLKKVPQERHGSGIEIATLKD
jgi:hypothetical protein